MVAFLVNFILVTTSIVMFVAPFFWLYWRKHRSSFSALGFNHYLENFFSSNYANWLIFFWACGEALIWFVIPEFLLLLIIFMRIHKKRVMVTYDILGTIVGTLLAFIIRLPEGLIARLPYVQDQMVNQTKLWFDEFGIMGLVYQPFSGVPYKVFTHLSWQYEFSLIVFIIFAVTVRIFRYIVVYGLLRAMYPKLHKIVYRNYVPLFLVATLIFSILLLKAYNAYS